MLKHNLHDCINGLLGAPCISPSTDALPAQAFKKYRLAIVIPLSIDPMIPTMP